MTISDPRTERTALRGVVSRSDQPVPTIDSGDTVSLETWTAWGDRITPATTMEGVLRLSTEAGPHDFTQRITWRGIVISGVPNMAYTFGYFRHSWTLRVDLVCDLVSRLFRFMRDLGATTVVPSLRPEDADMSLRPWSNPENAGYVMRSQHLMFKQGDREPWTHMLEHEEEQEILPKADLDDGSFIYK